MMRKKTILAALTIVMMLFTLIPASVSAAQTQAVNEMYVENLEMTYMSSIKDRSKYCDDVWAEIQQVYKEGRECYANLEDDDAYWDAPDYETMLSGLGTLTWVKSKDDLKEVKKRYLKEIDEEYKEHKKTDYSDYSWDLIQDGLYVGKKMINEATTFSEAAMGYSEAMLGMEWATTKEDLKEYRKECISTLSMVLNLCLDPDDYSEPVWAEIKAVYDEGVAAIKEAELEYELEEITEQYIEKICNISGLKYPVTYEVIEEILAEIMEPAIEFVEEMDETDYILERIEQAEEIIWDLEEELYEIEKRTDAEKLVNAALKKLKALPDRVYDEGLLKKCVANIKAAGNSGTSIKVTWKSNKDLDGYVVYRATSKNGTYEKIKEFYSGTISSFVDKGLTYGKTYYYKVKGMKWIDWEEEYTKLSAPVKGTPKLDAPSFKLSKAGSADVLLKWNKAPGADGYQIYRSNSVNGQFKLVKTVTKGGTVQWKDTSTVKGKTYCYKMRSYDKKQDGSKKYSGYTSIKTIKR